MLAVLIIGCAPDLVQGTFVQDEVVAPVDCPTPGPFGIAAAEVRCDGDVYALSVDTTGEVGASAVFVMDTASSDRARARSEDHTLEVVDGDWSCATYQVLGRSLGAGGLYARDATTGFGCDEASALTWAFAIDDADGRHPDCVAIGADPEGLVAGRYAADYIVTPGVDLRRCRAVR